MQYVTLARSPTCIGQIIGTPWMLPDHRYVEWIWSAGHQWRSPQCYPVRILKRLDGEFLDLQKEIIERENGTNT
jgi:hypothetical protein